MEYFKIKTEPTMNELVNWFQIKYTRLADTMKLSNHNAAPDEPNPYHIEDNVWAHTMMVCLQAENENKIVKICALLHDTGKPESREIIPFEKKKPVHTESNQIRNDGKNLGVDSGLQRVMPKSGTKSHFRGHEGLSFYKATSVLNDLETEGVIDTSEKIQILSIISLHGTLFDSITKDGQMRKPEKVFQKFEDSDWFENFTSQVRCDSTGRFFVSTDGRKSTGSTIGKLIFTREEFDDYHKENPVQPEDEMIKLATAPKITLLVGPPGAGKSTWRSANVKDEVVISRDDIMLEYAKGLGKVYIECNNCDDNGMVETTWDYLECDECGSSNQVLVETYSDIWAYLLDNDLHKEVDKLEQKMYQDAIKANKDIIIDRTNMSRKSRRKWLTNARGYRKDAIVFCTSDKVLYERNKQRAEETGKNITSGLVKGMMKSFMVPMYDEFDIIEWKF